MSSIFLIIASSINIPYSENLYFGNLKYLTDNSIIKPKLDFYNRSYPAELKKYIREVLGPYIILLTNTAVPYLPNFFAEVKGRNRNIEIYK